MEIQGTHGPAATELVVSAFKIHPESIEIEFAGWIYEFTYTSAGVGNVECMKALANSGHGLAAFVQRNLSGAFASKTRAPRIERGLW